MRIFPKSLKVCFENIGKQVKDRRGRIWILCYNSYEHYFYLELING